MKYLIAAIALVVLAPAPAQAHNEIVLDLIDKIEMETTWCVYKSREIGLKR